jgi:hypothetical protein
MESRYLLLATFNIKKSLREPGVNQVYQNLTKPVANIPRKSKDNEDIID